MARATSVSTPVRAVAFVIVVAAIVFACLFVFEDPLALWCPKDQTLIDLFQNHRSDFEALRRKMAEDHLGLMSRSTLKEGNLSLTIRDEYGRLLSNIAPVSVVSIDHDEVWFCCGSGCVGLSIGPGWSKGIAYIPEGKPLAGEIVDTLDGKGTTKGGFWPKDGCWLRPISDRWFLVKTVDDYDKPEVGKRP